MVLQASKNGIVNNTAAATLQQLVVSIFDKVVAEDSKYIVPSRIQFVGCHIPKSKKTSWLRMISRLMLKQKSH